MHDIVGKISTEGTAKHPLLGRVHWRTMRAGGHTYWQAFSKKHGKEFCFKGQCTTEEGLDLFAKYLPKGNGDYTLDGGGCSHDA